MDHHAKNGWSGGGFVSGPKRKEKGTLYKIYRYSMLVMQCKQMCTSIEFFPSSTHTVPAGYLINQHIVVHVLHFLFPFFNFLLPISSPSFQYQSKLSPFDLSLQCKKQTLFSLHRDKPQLFFFFFCLSPLLFLFLAIHPRQTLSLVTIIATTYKSPI